VEKPRREERYSPKKRIVTHEWGDFSVGTTVCDGLVDTLGKKCYPILEVMLDDFQDSRFVL
jgi:hypothetical protein